MRDSPKEAAQEWRIKKCKCKHFRVYITVKATNRDYVALSRDYDSLIKLVRRRCGFTVFSNDDIRTENDGEYVRL